MSTRSTLWLNDDFHLYLEAGDVHKVYLAISTGSAYLEEELILKIPIAAWKQMRQHTIDSVEGFLDMSDSEFRAEAERRVDAHRADLAEIRDSVGHNKEIRMIAGLLVYGPPETSREEMLRRFVEYYRPATADTGK